MRYSALATVLIGLSALCWTGCSTTRRATERLTVQGSEFRVEEARDSLREEILQNLNENLTEHEVVTWAVTGLPLTAYGLQERDTVRVERVTDRTTVRERSASTEAKKEEVKTVTVRDTAYIEKRDSVFVETNTNRSNQTNPSTGSGRVATVLKWIFWIIIGLIGLIVTVKVCLRM